MNRTEGLELLLRLMARDESAVADVVEASRRDLEEGLIGPVRRFRATLPKDRRDLEYGPEATAYVKRATSAGPVVTQGLILGLVDLVMGLDDKVHSGLRAASDLDLAAVRAERDDLLVARARAERQRDRARQERDTEAQNALELTRRETEARARIRELETTVLRLDRELLDAREAS